VGAKVTFTLEGVVGRIVMDDGKVNSIERVFVTEFEQALDRAEEKLARALVIEGRPGLFGAGLDLKLLPVLHPTQRRAFIRDFGRMVLRLYQFPRPVIASIEGHAVAGAALLALSCDVRLAVRGDYKIGLQGVAVGLPLPAFALEVARMQLPVHVHTRCIAFGESFGPERALELCIVDRLVAGGELRLEAMNEANRLAALPEPAFGLTKRALRGPAVAAAIAREEVDLDALLRDGPLAGNGEGPAAPPGET
jgi:enoyl-CoA hydratase